MIAQMLRETNKPVFVAVNKLDTYRHAPEASEFYALGLEHVFPVSAEHGIGFDDLMDTVTEFFPDQGAKRKGKTRDGDTIHVAVVGKPNAGKSTLINRLFGADRLLTSDIPGTTRD